MLLGRNVKVARSYQLQNLRPQMRPRPFVIKANHRHTLPMLRSAVGKTHDLRSDLWWTIPLRIFTCFCFASPLPLRSLLHGPLLIVHFGESLVVRLYSEIDHIHLISEAQCVSHLYPQVDCHSSLKGPRVRSWVTWVTMVSPSTFVTPLLMWILMGWSVKPSLIWHNQTYKELADNNQFFVWPGAQNLCQTIGHTEVHLLIFAPLALTAIDPSVLQWVRIVNFVKLKRRSTASAQLSAYAHWLETHRQTPKVGNDSYCSLLHSAKPSP